jgi:hypothetical protein
MQKLKLFFDKASVTIVYFGKQSVFSGLLCSIFSGSHFIIEANRRSPMHDGDSGIQTFLCLPDVFGSSPLWPVSAYPKLFSCGTDNQLGASEIL